MPSLLDSAFIIGNLEAEGAPSASLVELSMLLSLMRWPKFIEQWAAEKNGSRLSKGHPFKPISS